MQIFNHPQFQHTLIRIVFKTTILFSCISILLSQISCANSPPSETLPQSEVAVSNIEHASYRQLADEDISNVVDKLKNAVNAQANDENKRAEQLAQQILVDIELIHLKVQRITAENNIEALESNITALHHELQWREPVNIHPMSTK